MTIPVIETERLILRGFQPDDVAPAIEFLLGNRGQYLLNSGNRKDAWNIVAQHAGHWVLRGFGMWALQEKAGGTFLGFVGLHHPDHYSETELGWQVVDAAEGRGIAFEAATAARAFAAKTWNKINLVSYIEAANLRSVRLAERLNAVREATLDHGDGPFHIYRHPTPEALL